jgi:phosphoglycolate phosphatase
LPAAAIFDIDGTLVTFQFDVLGTRRALLAELEARGFDTGELGLTSPTQVILDAAREQVDSGGAAANFEDLRRRAFSILDAFEVKSAATTSVFPGAHETLDLLRAKRVRLAVVTNSGRRAASLALNRAGLSGSFELVLTRDDVEKMKPRPDGILQAVSMLGVSSKEVCYVGDSLYDIAAARLAGLKVVSVASGNYSPERLREGGADLVILSITELPRALGLWP